MAANTGKGPVLPGLHAKKQQTLSVSAGIMGVSANVAIVPSPNPVGRPKKVATGGYIVEYLFGTRPTNVLTCYRDCLDLIIFYDVLKRLPLTKTSWTWLMVMLWSLLWVSS